MQRCDSLRNGHKRNVPAVSRHRPHKLSERRWQRASRDRSYSRGQGIQRALLGGVGFIPNAKGTSLAHFGDITTKLHRSSSLRLSVCPSLRRCPDWHIPAFLSDVPLTLFLPTFVCWFRVVRGTQYSGKKLVIRCDSEVVQGEQSPLFRVEHCGQVFVLRVCLCFACSCWVVYVCERWITQFLARECRHTRLACRLR